VLPFRGSYDHTLDAKNRLTVPARYRADLSAGVLMARGTDGKRCISIWRPDDYDRFSSDVIGRFSPLDPRRADLQRFLYGHSQEAELDAAGRVHVPGFLSEEVQLGRELTIVGAGDKLELWSREAWKERRQALLGEVAEIAAGVQHTD
jgi:MraZ protein